MHHNYEKRYPSRTNALHSFLDGPPIVSIAFYRKMQNLGATLKFDLHFFAFNGITQTILVAFSMKMSRACSGTFSPQNDEFKSAKNIKYTCITCIIVPGLVELFYLSKPVC